MRSAQCPNCNAQLSFDDINRDFCFCQFCGTRIMLDDYRSTHRIVDEAKIKEIEANKILQMKKLEIYEKKRKASLYITITKIVVSIVLGLTGIVMLLSNDGLTSIIGLFPLMAVFWIWLLSDSSNKNEDFDFGDRISVPSGISGYNKKEYTTIKKLFENAGFTNVQCEPIEDITTGWLNRVNTVSSITIDGKIVTEGGKKFLPDASIIIYYHSRSQKLFR